MLKLDLSLSLIWVFSATGAMVGFSFPTTRMRKTVYGPSESLLRLKDLVKGKVFFSGDNFSMFYKFQSDIDKGTFGKVLENNPFLGGKIFKPTTNLRCQGHR